MRESFVPSIREYAARYQIDSRRLSPRQLLMHPGPVNRGRRALRRGDRRPQLADHRAGRERPGRADGDPVRAPGRRSASSRRSSRAATQGRTRPDPDQGARVTPTRADLLPRLAGRRAARAATSSSGAPPCSIPGPGIDGAHDVVVRDGEIAELAEPGAASRRPRRGDRGRGQARLPGLLRPARPPPDVPGDEDEEDIETGTRAAAAGGYCGDPRDGEHATRPWTRRRTSVALREQAAERGIRARRLPGLRDPRHGGRGADRDGRASRRRARSGSPTTGCRSPTLA